MAMPHSTAATRWSRSPPRHLHRCRNRYRPGAAKGSIFCGNFPYARGHILWLDQMRSACSSRAPLARAPAWGLGLMFLYGDPAGVYLLSEYFHGW
jgi:hypothetical protein